MHLLGHPLIFAQNLPVITEIRFERSDYHRQIAPNEIHAEEKESNAGSPHLWGHNLHYDSEQDCKPGLCKQIICYEGGHGQGWVQVQCGNCQWCSYHGTACKSSVSSGIRAM